MNLTNTVVDLSGAIPATGDLTQWANAGVLDILSRIKATSPGSLNLFAQEKTVPDGGLSVANTTVLYVHRDSIDCRLVDAKKRHEIVDAASLFYATAADPVYYTHEAKLYVKPASGSTVKASVVDPGEISDIAGTTAIAYFPTDKYNLVAMYAGIQNLMHRMVVLEGDTGFPSSVLTTFDTASWTALDYDFDAENINYNKWFQVLGDMIQNQEDTALAQMQMQKLQTFFAGDQQQLQKTLTRYQWMQGQYAALKQQYEQAFATP